MLSPINRLAHVAGLMTIALQPNNSWVGDFKLLHIRARHVRFPAYFNGMMVWSAASVIVLPVGYFAISHDNRWTHQRRWFLTAKAAVQHAVTV